MLSSLQDDSSPSPSLRSAPDLALFPHDTDIDFPVPTNTPATDMASFTLLPEHLERLTELGVPPEYREEVAHHLSLLILGAFDTLLGTGKEP